MNSTEKCRWWGGLNRAAAVPVATMARFSQKHRQVQKIVTAGLCAALTGLTGTPALATDWEVLSLVERINDCGKLTDSASRLDCYDRLNESLRTDEATASGEKTFRLPDIELTLIDHKTDSSGRRVFYFDNGQIWRQTEKARVTIPRGDAVPATLSPGILGSFNLRLGDSARNIKVKRIK